MITENRYNRACNVLAVADEFKTHILTFWQAALRCEKYRPLLDPIKAEESIGEVTYIVDEMLFNGIREEKEMVKEYESAEGEKEKNERESDYHWALLSIRRRNLC